MGTKLKGDIAEQIVVLGALQHGWEVSIPVGDRVPYDMIVDTGQALYKMQVKASYFMQNRWVVNTRTTRTNQRTIVIKHYDPSDFDFAVGVVIDLGLVYIIPSAVFCQRRTCYRLCDLEGKATAGALLYENNWDQLLLGSLVA